MKLDWHARRRANASGGFTLLELLVVLVILAAVAALVLPTLGFVRDQAKYTTAAAGAAEALDNLEIFRASSGQYPQRFDSLVDTSGAAYSKLYSGGWPLGTATSSGTIGYFLHNAVGMDQFMQHNPSTSDPNASTDSVNPSIYDPNTGEYSGGGNLQFLIVDPNTANPSYSSKLARIIKAAYPNQAYASSTTTGTDVVDNGDGTQTTTTTTGNVGIPAGHYLVALGIGSRTSCVGTTMTSAPSHAGAAQGTYGRYIAFFDVSAGPTGRGKVQLKMVTDSEFEVLSKNIANAAVSGPIDDQGSRTTTTTTTGPVTP